MKDPKSSRRRPRRASLGAEALEVRSLLTAGAGDTFAIMREQVTRPDLKVSVPFTVTPALISGAKGKVTIGIDVAAQTSSTVVPQVYGLEDMQTGRLIPVSRVAYAKGVPRTNALQGNLTTAVTATIPAPATGSTPHQFAVIVGGVKSTTGNLLVGFYLPGDANGDGTVNSTDIAEIKKEMGVKANTSTAYQFATDSNRDGQINSADLRLATANMGAKVAVSPVVAASLDAASDSGLQDRVTNIQTVHFTGTATPGASISYQEITGLTPIVQTTADATGNYSLLIPLGNGSNTFQVTSKDQFGQTIAGQIAPVTYSINAAPSV